MSSRERANSSQEWTETHHKWLKFNANAAPKGAREKAKSPRRSLDGISF